ncbi:MAG: SUMF1/EgtB/PvdO family nonheme iron enzyme [Bacteroidetes bacterium]|nr:SUMF1/EgtB/PvdO family nonheme iron enzyme [Bacteroidota bacterium]
MKKQITLFFALLIVTLLSANNISITNPSITGKNTTDHYSLVQFDLNWENSWRTSASPNNWDAAWVFVKFRFSENYVSAVGATSVNTPDYVSGAGATSSLIEEYDAWDAFSAGSTITIGSSAGIDLKVGMVITDYAGNFDPGTLVTAIIDATHFTVSPPPNTTLTGQFIMGSSTVIIVGTTAGLKIGMPVTVTSGTGVFAAGTVVTQIIDATTFKISTSPTIDLSGGAVVTGYGATITVTSTAGLGLGMPVSVTAGTGVFAAGSIVITIIDATHFTVSGAPTTPLSGGASVITGTPIWQHATLNLTGNTAPSGCSISPASDGIGAFIYRNSDGTGILSLTGIQLRWNYGTNGVSDDAALDIRVYAIEMVYVPQGVFALGSGSEDGGPDGGGGIIEPEKGHFFRYPTPSNTFSVTSEDVITVDAVNDDLYYDNLFDGWYGYGDATGPIPAAFPKGYNAFYCMKYEISQQAYVDFLNTLTTAQAYNRYFNNTGYNRNEILVTGNVYSTTNPYVACNYLSWTDLAAYLDWSGLRPMTELEFEKACRGTASPVPCEYAWGTAGIASSPYTLSNSGASNEAIETNYDTYSTNYVSDPGASDGYISDAGATGNTSSTTITVTSTAGLTVGMIVSVTAGTGGFYPNTNVSTVNDATTFDVNTPPSTDLSNGAIVSAYSPDKIITVASTSGLRIQMPVSVTAGTGVFAAGTVVTDIIDGTTFSVSALPATHLTGGATVVTGYANCGNAAGFFTTSSLVGGINAPLRVGIFAGTGGNTGRVTAGATFYGIMEMSGNLAERPVTAGNVAGRSFTGLHGDGNLNTNGDATVDYWPGINGNYDGGISNTAYNGNIGVTDMAGADFRGGAYDNSIDILRVSYRGQSYYLTYNPGQDGRLSNSGGRGVRMAP